jgi:hypothetical protein
MLRNIPEEWSSHLHRGGNLKPRIFYFFVLPRVSDHLTGVRCDVEGRSVLTARMLGRKSDPEFRGSPDRCCCQTVTLCLAEQLPTFRRIALSFYSGPSSRARVTSWSTCYCWKCLLAEMGAFPCDVNHDRVILHVITLLWVINVSYIFQTLINKRQNTVATFYLLVQKWHS